MFRFKQETEKKILGENMKELERLLTEIPVVTSSSSSSLSHILDHRNYYQNSGSRDHPKRHSNHHLFTSVPSSLSSGFLSGGFGGGSSDDGSCSSPSLLTPTFDGNGRRTIYPTTYHHLNLPPPPPPLVLSKNNSNESGIMFDDLSENLFRLNIGDDHHNHHVLEPNGFGFSEQRSSNRITSSPCNNVGRTHYPIEGGALKFNSDFQDYDGRFQMGTPISGSHDDMRPPLLGLPLGFDAGSTNSMESYFTHSPSPALYSSDPGCFRDGIDYQLELLKQQRRVYSNGGTQLQNQPSVRKAYLENGDYYCSNGDMILSNLTHSSAPLMYPELGLRVESPVCNRSVPNQKIRVIPNSKFHPTLLLDAGDIGAFSFEDGFRVQGNMLKYVGDKGADHPKGRKKNSQSELSQQSRQEKRAEKHNRLQLGKMSENDARGSHSPLPLQVPFSSLDEVQGIIYFLAKDQQGCRFLQKIFEEGTRQDVQTVFDEIIDHIVELMINPFGNYLAQKLLEVCSDVQQMQIVIMLTDKPGELVTICLNTHGTRVVQKLIETLNTRQQISLVVHALQPGFLDLIKDLNGNHVVQRCLQCLGREHNKFIFDAAAKFCVDIATHRHGCCVLNRCIAHSTGKHREKLIAEICANGFLLAQDAFGNYVVQYIIELKIPSAAAILLPQFESHYVYLSLQKFSSHVVEKCLKYFEQSRSRIIQEFLSVRHFDQLLQDPFANYVIQSALEVTKGPVHAALVEAIKPYTILRTSPYCKKLFSRKLLKK